MKEQDTIIKRILTGIAKERPKGACPAEEVLAGFVDGRLSEAESEAVFSHLVRCSACLESVFVLRDIMGRAHEEEAFRIPARVLARAGKLDPSRRGLVELVISFARGVAEVIKMSEQVTTGFIPALEPVRGGQVVSENLITVSKEFPPYLAEIDIEKTKPDRGEISLKLIDTQENRFPKGVRITIFKDDAELESTMLEDGSAVFENIRFGAYRLEITRVGEPIGQITLEMKGE